MIETILSTFCIFIILVHTNIGCGKKKKEEERKWEKNYSYSRNPSEVEKNRAHNRKIVQTALKGMIKHNQKHKAKPEITPATQPKTSEKKSNGPCTVDTLMFGVGNPFSVFTTEIIKDHCENIPVTTDTDFYVEKHETSVKIIMDYDREEFSKRNIDTKTKNLTSEDTTKKGLSTRNALNDWVANPPIISHPDNDTFIESTRTSATEMKELRPKKKAMKNSKRESKVSPVKKVSQNQISKRTRPPESVINTVKMDKTPSSTKTPEMKTPKDGPKVLAGADWTITEK